jgi:tripartite-type tricarboxylate transporter receptor subunit TctC
MEGALMTDRYLFPASVLLSLVLVFGGAMPAMSADFYEGKTVRLVVSTSPGGGYDTYARVIARHLGKHLPGNPKIIVENRPGSGGLLAGNYVYHSPRQDGTELLHIGGSSVIKQLTGVEQVKYDANKFQYVGAPYAESTVLVVTERSGFKELNEIIGPNARQVALGGIGTGSPNDVAAILLRDVLGAKVRLVTGYQGTSRIRLAMDSGEVDGMFNGLASLIATSNDQLKSGEYKVLLQVGREPSDELVNIPSISELAKTDEQRRLVRLTTVVPYQFARSFLMGPKVPKERVRDMQKAFEATMKDPAFLAEAKKSRLKIEPIKGEELQLFVREFLDMPKNEKGKVLKLITG